MVKDEERHDHSRQGQAKDDGWDFLRQKTLAFVSTLLFLSMSIASVAGCQRPPEEQLDGIYNALQDCVQGMQRAKGFLQPLKTFDFENATFLNDVLSSIEDGRSGLREAMVSVDKLEGFDYRGNLSRLGELIRELTQRARHALEELEKVHDGIEEVLASIRPALEEEATICQLEAPQSTQEWVLRLQRLDAALSASLQALDGIEVPEKTSKYRTYFLDLLTTLHNMVGVMIHRVSTGITGPDPRLNLDFQHFEELLSSYGDLVEDLDNLLLINQLESYLEEVELEINRLFLKSE
ncbi:MAG: hypothetical protein ACUVS1_08445 [Actinomycetota bacterium]